MGAAPQRLDLLGPLACAGERNHPPGDESQDSARKDSTDLKKRPLFSFDRFILDMNDREQIRRIVELAENPQGELPVFFFDVDNCLYSRHSGILELMIQRYICKNLEISVDLARKLQTRYYREYGLTIRGLLQHHGTIDPAQYNLEVDGGLPLEEILTPDLELRRMLATLKGVKKWAFTNAGQAHAIRCLNLLGIYDLFDGITYCDYTLPNFACKPEFRFYEQAMREAGVMDPRRCLLVDDSAMNVRAAMDLGWIGVYLGDLPSEHGHFQIEDIKDLPRVLPELWRGLASDEEEELDEGCERVETLPIPISQEIGAGS
ncbi:uncharacterized protein VTP21DRAFT_8574 [Calcarisporiella thermophila]|uniref:uncharacterized protein n=1 Tax=Calcarisporiella thermophila TaxID=911321 RepID=UPI0037422372